MTALYKDPQQVINKAVSIFLEDFQKQKLPEITQIVSKEKRLITTVNVRTLIGKKWFFFNEYKTIATVRAFRCPYKIYYLRITCYNQNYEEILKEAIKRIPEEVVEFRKTTTETPCAIIRNGYY